jgi:hypothetical protein
VAPSLLGALCLTLAVGCEPWAREASPQGKELKAILDSKRALPVAAPSGQPLKFTPVEIERRVGDGNAIELRAVVTWTLTQPPEETPEGGTSSILVLRLRYTDAQGKDCGSDVIYVYLNQAAGRATLVNLGKYGSPTAVTVTMERLIPASAGNATQK